MTQSKRQPFNILGFSGNRFRPSRARSLVEDVIQKIAVRYTVMAMKTEVFDLEDVMPELGSTAVGSALPFKISHIVERLTSADAIVIGTPVYKGSYAGLFKHFFDLLEPQSLAGIPVILTASGGGDRHALMVEHQLRPLFGFFSAHTIATSVYATESDYLEGGTFATPLRQRIECAVEDLGVWFTPTSSSSG